MDPDLFGVRVLKSGRGDFVNFSVVGFLIRVVEEAVHVEGDKIFSSVKKRCGRHS